MMLVVTPGDVIAGVLAMIVILVYVVLIAAARMK